MNTSEPDEPYTVMVGVSATSKSPMAMVWARAQAQANGGRVIAVRVYQVANVTSGPSGVRLSDATGRRDPACRPARAVGA